MRVLSVVPRYAVTVGSLKARRGGTVIGKTREERGKLQLEFTPFSSCRGRITLIQSVPINGMCLFKVRAATAARI